MTDRELEDAMIKFMLTLASSQRDLEPEDKRILYKNLDGLYIYDVPRNENDRPE